MRAGIGLEDGLFERFRDRYFERLLETIHEPGPRKGVMPGVRDLLDALAPRRDVFLALLTGNYERAARIKLEHFDLWRYFRCGAYGDDVDRSQRPLSAGAARAFACGAPRVFRPLTCSWSATRCWTWRAPPVRRAIGGGGHRSLRCGHAQAERRRCRLRRSARHGRVSEAARLSRRGRGRDERRVRHTTPSRRGRKRRKQTEALRPVESRRLADARNEGRLQTEPARDATLR